MQVKNNKFRTVVSEPSYFPIHKFEHEIIFFKSQTKLPRLLTREQVTKITNKTEFIAYNPTMIVLFLA